ncbi:ferredoxin--NADP reductase [Williamsia sp.]|uniref:ferredoxin--NADP reductase n=1 Tax=Williamsia sp. TaxID=1872085 RepID=UPI002F951495
MTAQPRVLTHVSSRRADEAFYRVPVTQVIRETADTVSLLLDTSTVSGEAFTYRAGQFLTLRVEIDGSVHDRCYSMSSAPMLDRNLQVTVKRERGGVVSNWVHDNIDGGSEVEVSGPGGVFVLGPGEDREIVAFAGGSGITPVFSIIRSALATSSRRIRLLYANRDQDSVIFAGRLDELINVYPSRLTVEHHLDSDNGVVDADEVRTFVLGVDEDADYFICGPGPFMDTVEAALKTTGSDLERLRTERFVKPTISAHANAGASMTETVGIRLNGRKTVVDYREGNTLLQTGRAAGIRPPAQCETGSCATCIARLVDGEVTMMNNDVLTQDEIDDGWILTCQSIPMTTSVRIDYE